MVAWWFQICFSQYRGWWSSWLIFQGDSSHHPLMASHHLMPFVCWVYPLVNQIAARHHVARGDLQGGMSEIYCLYAIFWYVCELMGKCIRPYHWVLLSTIYRRKVERSLQGSVRLHPIYTIWSVMSPIRCMSKCTGTNTKCIVLPHWRDECDV